jgi:hypothetical protein
MARFWNAKIDSYSSAGVWVWSFWTIIYGAFSGLEIEPYIVLEGRILSNAFASRDFLWSDHGPTLIAKKRAPKSLPEDSHSQENSHGALNL